MHRNAITFCRGWEWEIGKTAGGHKSLHERKFRNEKTKSKHSFPEYFISTSFLVSCITGFCSKDSECCDADFGHDIAKPVPEHDFHGLVATHRGKEGLLPPLNADRGIGDCNPKRVRFDSSKSSTYKKGGISFNNTDPALRGESQSSGFTGLDDISVRARDVRN